MILTGLEIITRNLVRNLRNVAHQQQPCGVDLTLRQVSKFSSAGIIDFDNSKRRGATVSSLPFHASNSTSNSNSNTSNTITLPPGPYLLTFNETVKIPLNCLARVLPRSSLWRSGVSIESGIVDAGYEGAMGALMDVKNPMGVVLWRDAKIAQIVFEELRDGVRKGEGYGGIYQGSEGVGGRDGMEKEEEKEKGK